MKKPYNFSRTIYNSAVKKDSKGFQFFPAWRFLLVPIKYKLSRSPDLLRYPEISSEASEVVKQKRSYVL